jgi:TRAP-type mannitol/chloroaromatic compound transport system permease large subunit
VPAHPALFPPENAMLTLSIFVVLLALIMIDLPIVVAIALTAVLFFVALGHGNFLAMLPQRMYSGTTGFVLLAVPFFILAGNLMNSGGITTRIFRFAKALVGHVPGDLGQKILTAAARILTTIIKGITISALIMVAYSVVYVIRTAIEVAKPQAENHRLAPVEVKEVAQKIALQFKERQARKRERQEKKE